MDDAKKFESLVRSRHPCVLMQTYEEADALELVRRYAESKNLPMFVWSVDTGLRDGLIAEATPIPDTTHAAPAMLWLSRQTGLRICVVLDLIGHLHGDPTALRHLRSVIASCIASSSTLVLIDHATNVPPVIEAHSVRLDLSFPGEEEIEQIILRVLRQEHRRGDVQVDIRKSQMRAVVQNLRGLTRRQIEAVITETVAEDRRFDGQAVDDVVAAKRRAVGSDGVLEFIQAPAKLEDVGGLSRVKRWVETRYKAMGLGDASLGVESPRGVLLLGVQGAGKSLCAKAIATAWQRPLLRLDPGALYDRFVGESERRLRESLGRAERMSPIVLWIDEIEKGFSSAASTSSDGGLSRRMFGMLLTWMQEHTHPVFLVATANDIEALPPELLRKGRFDEIFFVDLPTHEVRQQIASIHLSKRKQAVANFDLNAIAAASEGFSGSEIEQAIISALLEAVADARTLTTGDIVASLRGSPPLSVTMAEKITALRQWAITRTVPAD